ncbi:hypothetical protein FI667_g168, partial [Globisporangium splendens]
MDEHADVVAQPESRFDELRGVDQQGLSLDGVEEKVPEHHYHLDEGFRSSHKQHEDEEEMCITVRSRVAPRWKRELQHVCEEKREIEEAFRRLDQEIANGYNLVERKEKELKIAELVAKIKNQTEQLALLHGVFSTLETKHASSKESRATLKSNYVAALATIEQLQDTVNQMQAKLIHAGGDQQQRLANYEQKLQSWERKYLAMERNCADRDQRVQILTQEMESLLEDKAHLEREVDSAHDQLTRMTGFVKTMEAKLEASMQNEQAHVNVEKLDARIRLLEDELLTKTRAYADLNQTFDEYLSCASGAARKTSSSRGTMSGRALGSNSSASQPGSSRLKAMSSRIATLTDKLRVTEEQSALEQMQQRPLDEDDNAYLRLARENYLLSGSYQVDMLTGHTGAAAFSEFPTQSLASAAPKAKNFAPFRVVSVAKRKNDGNQQEDNEEAHTMEQLAIVADANDANGASYLNRSKINAFLQFIQGHAAKEKFKELIFTKLAECITKLRELKFQFGAETTTQRATIQMLQREAEELKHKLKTRHSSSQSRHKLLMKLIDVYVEKQQQKHRQSTFLTQMTSSSDILISNALTLQEPSCDCLDLSKRSIDDDDIVEVLLKIQVSGVAFHEIRLDGNTLTDAGATRLAHFLEKSPSCVKIVSADENAAISYHGVDVVKQGLLRNRSIQRIAMDPSNHVIEALEAQDESALHGNPTDVLRVVLPKTSRASNTSRTVSEDEVNHMVDRMHQMGLAEQCTQSRSTAPSASFAIYGDTSFDPRRKRVHSSNRAASAQPSLRPTAAAAARRQSARQQTRAPTVAASRSRHATIAATKRATLWGNVSGANRTPAATASGSRAAIYDKAHVAMARMQKTSRFPMGTRISKYFPGYKDPFEGTVDDYSKFSGFYHISYDDGDSEEMTEADLEAHVLRLPTIYPSESSSSANAAHGATKKLILNLNDNAPGVNYNGSKSGKNSPSGSLNGSNEYTGGYQPPKSTRSSPKAASPTTARQEPGKSQEEINNLIGKRISKPSVDGNGKEYIVYGTVSTYFNATNKYRVLYLNGQCEDLTHQDVLDSLPLYSPSDEETKKRKLADGVATVAEPSASPKKLKSFESHGDADNMSKFSRRESGDDGVAPSAIDLMPATLDPAQVLTNGLSYMIARSITYVVVSTSPDSAAKDEQLVILNDGTLKAKAALTAFVEKGGLATFCGLLTTWSGGKETEAGMVVIMKILGVLPGVTTDAVLESGIGRKLNDIKKHGAMWGLDDSTTDLAKWTINKLKQELNVATKKSKPAREQKESSKSPHGGKDSHDEKRAVKSQPKAQERNQPSNGPDSASSKRSNSANHLRDLMGSRNGKGKDVLGNALSSKRKLGPAYAHRARRSTVILDAVARRFTDQVENVVPEKGTEEEDTERESRIRFGEPSVIEFEIEVEVSKLRSWAPIGRRPLPAPPRPAPAKQPLKSILRVRLEPIEQAPPPEPDHITAPPTIQTVSMSAHASRQLKESGPTLYVRSETAHDADQERSPDDDIPEPPQAFFTRKEQTNRSPPPDFDDRLSIDGERDSMSSLPESDASAAIPVYEIKGAETTAASLPSPMQQGSVQPVLITSE